MPDDADLDTEATETDTTTETQDDPAARRLKSQRDAAKRELVFVKAGIDTDTPQGRLAMKGYDGDLTVDAVKAWHTEVFGQPAVSGAEPTPAEIEIARDRAFVSTGGDGTPSLDEPEHPHRVGLAAAGETWKQTRDDRKAAKAFLDVVLEAAHSKSDGRVILETVNESGAQRHRAAS